MKPVMMPSGISCSYRLRASVSVHSRNSAPAKMESGSVRRLLSPAASRAKCGTTKPSQPMVPLMHTAEAVSSVAHTTIIVRSRRISAPTNRASRSPSDSTLMRQRIATSTPAASSITGTSAARLPYSDLARLPICQYTISASSVSGSARYFISPSVADIKPDTTIPASTKITAESRPINRGSAKVINTANSPPAKAAACVPQMLQPSKIDNAAPTQAPEETPSKSGDTSGLRKIPW